MKNKRQLIFILISIFLIVASLTSFTTIKTPKNYETEISIGVDYDSDLNSIYISKSVNFETPVYVNTTGESRKVYVRGDFAYVADYRSGLAVINISDPTSPGTPVYEDTFRAFGVYVKGDFAYVADYSSGLAVINISDPTNPGTPIYVSINGRVFDVYVIGDYAYVAISKFLFSGISGLAVINISDPTSPGTPIYVSTTGEAWGVYVSGDFAYVADHTSGLAVINISDPTNPGAPFYEDTTGSAGDVYVSGDYAYVADGYGLAVLNISDPTNPGMPVYEVTTGSAMDVYVSGDYAYVAAHDSGLAVIDISDPTNPGTPIYEDTWAAFGVYVSGDFAYVADRTLGLAIIKIDIGDPIILNTPNDLTVEFGYSGQILSWTATDANPNNYKIELHGTGIVTGPTAWTSGNVINYNIPNGLTVGVYFYTINFTDVYSNSKIDNITFTVEDTTNPIIISEPNNLTLEIGYSGQILSWIAIDAFPNNYLIELQGTGIVTGPTTWTSRNVISYNITDGLSPGVYVYNITFADESGNSISNTVTVTINSVSIPIGNYFLIFFGFSIICLIFTSKKKSIRKF